MDRSRKLRIFAREGVSRLWLVNPLQRTIEILRLDRAHWTVVTAHGGDDAIGAIDLDPDPSRAPPRQESSRAARSR